MTKLSVVINTLNEQENLPGCLDSVKDIADEIVVVDMHSTDHTRQIAENAKAKVYLHEPTGYVEPARNFAISKASGDWILILDADEKISTSLGASLRKIIKDKNSADYYRLPRRNIIFGKWMKYSRWWPDYNIRFFKKGAVVWSEIIHSIPETRGKGVDMDADKSLAIIHYHYQTVEQYLERLNRYTSQSVKTLVKKGEKFDWKDLIQKPTSEFLSRFFSGRGYKDGIHGLVLAGLQAFSEFVVYVKLWQNDDFSQKSLNTGNIIDEISETQKEINYWKADALVKEKGGFINRLRRKLRI